MTPAPADLLLRAVALHQAGQAQDAAALYRRLLIDFPAHADALALLGVIARRAASPENAERLLRRALTAVPGHGPATANLNDLLACRVPLPPPAPVDMQRLETAAQAAEADDDPRRLAQARAAMTAAAPDQPAAWFNLGLALASDGRPHEALEAYRRAGLLAPALVQADVNRAALLRDMGALPAAIRRLRRALRADPACFEARINLAHALLAQGSFAEGWRRYEDRLGNGDFTPPPGLPAWRGAPLCDGRPLLVWAEQGLGDEIMFASLIPDLLAQKIPVRLECDPRLRPLYARSFIDAHLVDRHPRISDGGLAEPAALTADAGAQVAAGSLPRFFRHSLGDFPRRGGYLRADPERVAAARRRHGGGGVFLIGLTWFSANPGTGPRRSIPLIDLARALDRPGVRLISLQYGDVAADLAGAEAAGLTVRQDPEIDPKDDIDGLAALISALDLAVCVDNATAHLAGALGGATWVLPPFAAEWRWMRNRDDSPWYPAMRLFRQPRPDDWSGVLRRIKAALDERLTPTPLNLTRQV